MEKSPESILAAKTQDVVRAVLQSAWDENSPVKSGLDELKSQLATLANKEEAHAQRIKALSRRVLWLTFFIVAGTITVIALLVSRF